MVRVKVCGITNVEDALVAAEYGADALGFVFASSVRRVTPALAAQIIDRLPPFVHKVGVFVDADCAAVKETMSLCHLDFAQLHGSEAPDYCGQLPAVIKAFRVRDEGILSQLPAYKTAAYLLDAYHPRLSGGTGCTFDWDIAIRAKAFGPVILSGGLNHENVAEAVRRVRPAAVDVSSGVESAPGKKDHRLLRLFIRAAKSEENDN